MTRHVDGGNSWLAFGRCFFVDEYALPNLRERPTNPPVSDQGHLRKIKICVCVNYDLNAFFIFILLFLKRKLISENQLGFYFIIFFNTRIFKENFNKEIS